jgi:nucleoside-diphosphate-sugar epimerase
VRATKQHYAESKLLAEREAWRIVREEQPEGRGMLLATILPTQCLGPLMQPYLNTSGAAWVGSSALARVWGGCLQKLAVQELTVLPTTPPAAAAVVEYASGKRKECVNKSKVRVCARAREAGMSSGMEVASLRPSSVPPRATRRAFTRPSRVRVIGIVLGRPSPIPSRSRSLTQAFVDVREVALAHILALEGGDSPHAQGRFMLMAGSIPWHYFAALVSKALGPVHGALVPTAVEAGPPPYPQAVFSVKRTYDLGIRYRPLEDSVADCARSVLEKGFLKV